MTKNAITFESAARTSGLAGKPGSTTPRLDALSRNGVDVYRLKTFLDEFGQVLIDQTAVECFNLFKSREFREIQTTAEALSEGAACFPTFFISLGAEWDEFSSTKPIDDIPEVK